MLLQEAWDRDRMPILDGIIFPDDTYVEIFLNGTEADFEMNRERCVRQLQRARDAVHLSSIKDLGWSWYCQTCEYISKVPLVKLVAGEGSYGSEGFVASIDGDSDLLMWLMYFESTNPFEDVRLEGDLVIARSTHGREWTINLWEPTIIAVD